MFKIRRSIHKKTFPIPFKNHMFCMNCTVIHKPTPPTSRRVVHISNRLLLCTFKDQNAITIQFNRIISNNYHTLLDPESIPLLDSCDSSNHMRIILFGPYSTHCPPNVLEIRERVPRFTFGRRGARVVPPTAGKERNDRQQADQLELCKHFSLSFQNPPNPGRKASTTCSGSWPMRNSTASKRTILWVDSCLTSQARAILAT